MTEKLADQDLNAEEAAVIEDVSDENTTKSAAEQNSVEFSVQDLAVLKQIIDLASQRGAFKPTEMVAVGKAYTKLDAFLNAVAAQQKLSGDKE